MPFIFFRIFGVHEICLPSGCKGKKKRSAENKYSKKVNKNIVTKTV